MQGGYNVDNTADLVLSDAQGYRIQEEGEMMNGVKYLLIAVFCVSLVHISTAVLAAGFCDPLPPAGGIVEYVSTESVLRSQAYNAAPGTTIIINPGTYHMGNYLHIINNNITLRGATGNRDDVILDFGGMISGYFGVLVDGDDVTIADLTIRNTHDHGVSIGGADRPVLYNLHIIDSNDQLVKVNPIGDGSEDGLLACSLLEYTTSAPNTYTNGISAHFAHRWTVRDNTWRRIRTSDDDTPVQTILFWSGSTDTVVERNLLVDCSRGIAFGDSSHGAGDHFGGVVRNNIIYSTLPHDTAIEMVHAEGWKVAHNTVMLMNPLSGLTWGIEARFSDSDGVFYNNITNMDIWPDRNGAAATADPAYNLTSGTLDWFVNPAELDFRLTSTGFRAIDHGTTIDPVGQDYHGEPRDGIPDIGADEWLPPLSAAIEVLQILSGLDVSNELLTDLDGDGLTGLAEVMFMLDKMAVSP